MTPHHFGQDGHLSQDPVRSIEISAEPKFLTASTETRTISCMAGCNSRAENAEHTIFLWFATTAVTQRCCH